MKLILTYFICAILTACAQEKTPAPGDTTPHIGVMTHDRTADCSVKFHKSGLCLSYEWETKPTENTEGTFLFKTYRPNLVDQSAVQVSLAEVPDVLLWMPSMGHSSSPITVSLLDIGTYRASHVYFVMPGNWEIHFQLKTGEVVDDEAIIPIVE